MKNIETQLHLWLKPKTFCLKNQKFNAQGREVICTRSQRVRQWGRRWNQDTGFPGLSDCLLLRIMWPFLLRRKKRVCEVPTHAWHSPHGSDAPPPVLLHLCPLGCSGNALSVCLSPGMSPYFKNDVTRLCKNSFIQSIVVVTVMVKNMFGCVKVHVYVCLHAYLGIYLCAYLYRCISVSLCVCQM